LIARADSNREVQNWLAASVLQASGLRGDVSVFRLNARPQSKTGSEPAVRRNTAERVYTIEAAHNPELGVDLAGDGTMPLVVRQAAVSDTSTFDKENAPRIGCAEDISRSEPADRVETVFS
jgi:hypothetical protein